MHDRLTTGRRWLPLVVLATAALSCNLPGTQGVEGTPAATVTTVPDVASATPSALAEPSQIPSPTHEAISVPRIGVRTLDGVAEFYNTATGEIFTPRGVNYVDFYPTERNGYEDRFMNTAVYDPARVRSGFRHLAEHGYNTV